MYSTHYVQSPGNGIWYFDISIISREYMPCTSSPNSVPLLTSKEYLYPFFLFIHLSYSNMYNM